ncbi:MAG: bifunctional demethylmenaquinone methyltransferase/2-methoxy-6-polyprenyl-1,4-benzoquinol methylase UbiE [Thermodesulfovibrionales bacterium]|nr:bifunctional demethylmenaquinone methyltransferase/2-methoxy-6-polyprenyl-1,4-benzoquinol methylase UbiE [Thermodesulfovibrionales bacterium]
MAKKEYLIELFGRIYKRYDLLNHVLSLYLDKRWRRSLTDQVRSFNLGKILDACTGTCDLAMEFAIRYPGAKIIGIDISDRMLKIGLVKIKRAGLNGRIILQQSDLFHLSFKDEVFDAVSIGFGFRNLHDFRRGIREMVRVLKKDGLLLILELSLPQNPILKSIYLFYLKNIMPKIGGLISGSKYSYDYLSSSIVRFPEKDEVIELLEAEGLRNINYKSLSGGIASIYMGKK